MGYRTVFTIDTDKEVTELEELTKYNLNCFYVEGNHYEGEGRWYSWEDDIKKVSLQNPGVLFTLHGEGEGEGDLWDAYIMDGKIQICPAQIIYAPFDKELLK